ncbi:amidase [Microlunatus endophyticus]|uniref:Amidase n=1 Tax=Microlunatus endophyticus TaxID=1716077 RepID=A0A917W721_9ACTN|nr:amidase family protein [Microlunatus endophyticus]GGL72203.1 amidase [Microlunatus endophyticus]
MTDGTELIDRDATDLARMLREEAVSATEVMQAHLERIERLNPYLNAIVDLQSERALEGARALDHHHDQNDRGPLYGLPTAHKDLVPARGFRFTEGSPIFADRIADEDDLIVTRMAAAGAIAIGKTNVPEFGLGSHSFNPVYGVTRNPYDLSRTAGGSSGGAAAALAARLLPIADGSDTGGSLRNPASFCNVTSIRPSPGTVPSGPGSFPYGTLAVKGPMGRSVADVALLLSVLSGSDERSPLSVGLDATELIKPTGRAIRVAWSADLNGLATVDPVVITSLEPVITDIAERLGWQLDATCPDLGPALDYFRVIRAMQLEQALGPLVDQHPDLIKPDAIWNVEIGRRLQGPEIGRALHQAAEIHQAMTDFFQTYDLLITPTCQVPPFPVGIRYPDEIAGTTMQDYLEWMRIPSAITGTACPAMSLPATFTPEGLPIGLQVVAPFRREGQLLGYASLLESALRDRTPTLLDEPVIDTNQPPPDPFERVG